MNNESAPGNRASSGAGSVINPWLSASLIVALAGSAFLSAVLILKMGGFEDMKRQADELELQTAKTRVEFTSLQIDVESLSKQKEALAPTVADWEKRLKEKAAAEAALATLEGKQQQKESDIAQGAKRLEEITREVLESEKQKTELNASIEKLKSELNTLTKTNIDGKALLTLASDAEGRLNNATNALASADTRLKQLEADAIATKTRLDQFQKEVDALRVVREKSNTDLAAFRQQIQSAKDELTKLDPQVADLKARQTAVQEEEQKLAKLQQQSAAAETRVSEMESRQTKAASEFAQMTNRMEQARSQALEWETKRAIYQQAETDLFASRKLSREFSAKQDESTREVSRLEAIVEKLKKEREALEKEIGLLEGQKTKSPSEGK